ncbi:IgGFc-binding protein [Polyangium sorediatum]|uniref:IgGFc-binding protein n=1 Tax=Polyangium sorediatum TaxID=889274 RepID=A0ABT6NLU1_9BACT|nr:IgGFc-binding protein [Polyangium sorediatum]MDI1429291.1 IgGFc-binding protein [Polyangium sorediatum]
MTSARLKHTAFVAFALLLVPGVLAVSCSATSNRNEFGDGGAGGEGPGGPGGPGSGGMGGDIFVGSGGSGGLGGGDPGVDPTTCAEAAAARTYIGCDFWPTVVANNVWSIFDYAVVVANAGDQPAEVTVTRGANTIATATVPPNDLAKIYLPWVPELKGPDANSCGSATPLSNTVRVPDGAYHLVTTRPVTVYQFNALEYGPQGGPPGKDWSTCPGPECLGECLSYSNDASLLLPSTAMTGNYRVTGIAGWPDANIGSYFAITGTEDGTSVQVKLSGAGEIVGGGGLPSTGPNGLASFTVNRGEVVEIVFSPNADPSGSQVFATKPVQVIAGVPCINVPLTSGYCDHIEESVFPAETLGKRYIVTVPTSPGGGPVGHVVRIYGNVNGTKLTYAGQTPPGAPLSINAGQVFDLGQVNVNFEISGDHEFAVGMFQLGSSLIDPFSTEPKGDPAQSLATAVEQYRLKYVFLAPSDYDESYVDVVQPVGAQLVLDGQPVAQTPTVISSGFGVVRLPLGPGKNGSHVLTATEPVGIQVMGYGAQTSYQYPGGLNLAAIAPPPPPPK